MKRYIAWINKKGKDYEMKLMISTWLSIIFLVLLITRDLEICQVISFLFIIFILVPYIFWRKTNGA